jgi:hypothetical protein
LAARCGEDSRLKLAAAAASAGALGAPRHRLQVIERGDAP